jgi:HNH endonuclease
MTPFVYPDAPHVRRHGPTGYTHYERYRPWLRDEFAFRCVYCLRREQWGVLKAAYHLDHFHAQALQPQAVLDYDNLLYACAACNTAKGEVVVPDPCTCMLAGHVIVDEDGSIHGSTPDARRVIGKLGLDAPDYCEFRMLVIGIVQLAAVHNPSLFRMLMKYPDDLPDLASLRPPQNTRPQGVRESFRARRESGQLPETY